MPTFKLIESLEATDIGPMLVCDGEMQPVHLRQGDLDGACGPYCLCMVLMMCGAVSRRQLESQDYGHHRSRLAKLFGMLEEYSQFFQDGVGLDDLVLMLDRTYQRVLSHQVINGSGVEIRDAIRRQVEEDHPVILQLNWDNGPGHWVVVIGVEYSGCSSEKQMKRLLLLDPSCPSPKVSAWNGVVETVGLGGRYPYLWWTTDQKVQFRTALAIWRC